MDLIKSNKLLEDTRKWLSSLESSNTRENYERHINNFCQFLCNKNLEEINTEILVNQDINYQKMLQYKTFLSDKYNSNTIRTKIYSVMSWLAYLSKLDGYNIEPPANLRIDRKSMPKSRNNNGSKPFTHSEMLAMIKKAKDYSNGEMKSCLLELAYVTAWRKEAILNSDYGELYKLRDNCNFWLMDIIDKGQKEDTKSIPSDLVQRLLNLNPQHKDNDKIFNLSKTAVDNLIIDLKRDLNIQGDKTFHGIKKASVNRVFDLTDNLIIAQKHACHENIDTTVKSYIKYTQSYEDMMSLHILDDVNIDIFNNLSKDELLKLISNSEDKVKFALLNKYKKENK